jgi:hypothetical protein
MFKLQQTQRDIFFLQNQTKKVNGRVPKDHFSYAKISQIWNFVKIKFFLSEKVPLIFQVR